MGERRSRRKRAGRRCVADGVCQIAPRSKHGGQLRQHCRPTSYTGVSLEPDGRLAYLRHIMPTAAALLEENSIVNQADFFVAEFGRIWLSVMLPMPQVIEAASESDNRAVT